MEGAGHRGDDGEEDEGGQEAQDQGEGEPDGGLARCRLSLQPGTSAEGFGSGGERLRRWGSPAFRRLEGGCRRAELVKPGSVGGFSERDSRGPAQAQDRCRQTQVLMEDLWSPLGDPEYGLVRVEAGPQGRAEQIEDGRCCRASCGQPPFDRASSANPHRNRPCGYGKEGNNCQTRNRPRQGNAEEQTTADPNTQPTSQPAVSASTRSITAMVDSPPRS
jgi:hypothetical protein